MMTELMSFDRGVHCGGTVECCRSGGFIAQKPIKSTTAEHSTNVHKMHVRPHFGNTMLAVCGGC
jgi:hypothetical protein